MATYYMRADGTAANKAAATGPETSQSACMNISVHNGETFSSDTVKVADNGGVYRSTIQFKGGATYENIGSPEISGADIMTTWASYGGGAGSTWQKSSVTTEPKQVFMDDTRLTKGSDKTTLSDHEWIWEANVLYVRDDTGDPDTSGVTIEASQRNHAATVNGGTARTIDGIDLCKGNSTFGGGSLYGNGAALFTIQNCTLRQAYTSAINYYDATFDSGACTVQDNTVYDCGGNGIQVSDHGTGWTIDGNEIYDFGLLAEIGDHNYTAGIKIASSTATGHTVENNHIYNGGQGGADSAAGVWCDNAADSNVIRYNHIHDLYYEGVRVELSDSCDVYYNIIHDCSGDTYAGGIFVSRDVHSNEVYNNTIYNCTYGIFVAGQFPQVSDDVTNNLIKNNIVRSCTTRALYCAFGGENDGTYGSGNVYTYNSFGAEATSFIEYGVGTTYNTLSAWETAVGDSSEAGNNQSSDPEFVNAGGSDAANYKLLGTSPCIDAGTDVSLTRDYGNGLVPRGSAPDMGAWEYVASVGIMGAGTWRKWYSRVLRRVNPDFNRLR